MYVNEISRVADAGDDVLDIRPMTRRIGAEVFGIDLREPFGDRATAELRKAIADHQVIFFREQALEIADLMRFGRLFGRLAFHTGVKGLPEYPEVVRIHADEHSARVAGDNWHSDLSCNPEPPMGSILYMHTLPEVGGDTLFSSMYEAYDALSPAMRAFLDPLTAVHDGDHVYRPFAKEPLDHYPCSTHPIVRTHPVTGRKALYVNQSYTIRIPELSEAESAAVLALLYDHVKNPNFQVRFRWEPHSIAFWDNRCTQHLAVWDYFPDTRSGYRVTIAGEKPE
jgi:taurine dioxygenase